jgi:putative FmdB family regulatory protein
MPIYEYRCPNGHTFELFQRFADAPIEVCQECGTGPVEKILFPVAVHFKGSGFYATDYGRGGRKPGKDGDGGTGGSSEGGSSASEGGKAEKATSSEKGSDGGSGSGDKGSGGKSSGGDKTAGGSD